MGNRKNTKERRKLKRTFDVFLQHDLKETRKGPYYMDWIIDEKRPSMGNDVDEEDVSMEVEEDSEASNSNEEGVLLEDEVDSILTGSERKLLAFPPVDYEEELVSQDEKLEEDVNEEGSRIMDISLLTAALTKAAKCSACDSPGLTLKEKSNVRRGWASTIYLFCPSCEEKTTFSSSKHLGDNKTNSTEINRSLVLGMRSIGRGRKAADILSAHLGLPPPIWPSSWVEHTRVLDDVASDSLQEELKTSVRRLKKTKIELGEVTGMDFSTGVVTDEQLDNLTLDYAVSFDGSWKSRGFHSRHGFVSAISIDTGEVLDCVYLTSLCNPCAKWTGKKDTPEYLDFIADHFPSCQLNHEGSSQSMEVEGVKRLYERSEDHGLRYTTYVGDGDSRSFSTISRLQPYGPDVDIVKEECIGHIQKRMGSRLRSLIAKTKGTKLADGKGLQGPGRLTLARVNAFQRFYGHTLRSHAGDPEKGSRSTMAMLKHYSNPPDHSMCPEGASSWCKFKQDDVLGTTTYVLPKQPLPKAVVDHITPVFTSLASVSLLQQTQKALTQNANESLHHLIWSLAPKDQFNSTTEVSLAVSLAVMRFNRGLSATYQRIFAKLGINLPRHAGKSFNAQDKNRIRTATYAASEKNKQARAAKNQAKYKDRGFTHSDYSSGAFHEGLQREPPRCKSCGNPRKGHRKGACTVVQV